MVTPTCDVCAGVGSMVLVCCTRWSGDVSIRPSRVRGTVTNAAHNHPATLCIGCDNNAQIGDNNAWIGDNNLYIGDNTAPLFRLPARPELRTLRAAEPLQINSKLDTFTT